MIVPIILVAAAIISVGWALWSRDELKDLRQELADTERRLKRSAERLDEVLERHREDIKAWDAERVALTMEHRLDRREMREDHSAEMAKQKAYQQKQLDALLLFMELHPDLADNFGVRYNPTFAPPELRGQLIDVSHEKVANYLHQQEQSDRFSEYVTAKRDALRGPKEESNG